MSPPALCPPHYAPVLRPSFLLGTVLIACWEDIPPDGELRTMLTGRGVSLESQFRLTYSMILSLLRVEDLKVRLCGVYPTLLPSDPQGGTWHPPCHDPKP